MKACCVWNVSCRSASITVFAVTSVVSCATAVRFSRLPPRSNG